MAGTSKGQPFPRLRPGLSNHRSPSELSPTGPDIQGVRQKKIAVSHTSAFARSYDLWILQRRANRRSCASPASRLAVPSSPMDLGNRLSPKGRHVMDDEPRRRPTGTGLRGGAPLARRPPPQSDPSRRGVAQAEVVEVLMTGGYAHLIAEGGTEEARGLASEALDRLVCQGLAYRTGALGERRFDPAEVVNGLKWASLRRRDDFWRERWVETERRMAGELDAQDRGPFARLRVGFVRHFNLGLFAHCDELLLRAPLPLDGQDHRVTELKPEVHEPLLSPLAIDDGRMTVRLRRSETPFATLGWSATLAPCNAPVESAPLTAADTALYLRPAEGFVRVDRRVRELAARWADGVYGWEAVMAFWRCLNESFCLGVIGYEEFEAVSAIDWVLDHGWFDCFLGSALLVSLCRAHGMPSRLVRGHFLYPRLPAVHTWAEVWIDGIGWTSLDLAGWNLSAGGEDLAWRDVFFGCVDARMVTERPPRRVTGPMSMRLPATWRILQRARAGALEICTVD